MANFTYSLDLRNTATGAPLIGASLVELKSGAIGYAFTEVGNGIYMRASIPQGRYTLWINGVNTNQSFAVGSGEVAGLGYSDGSVIGSNATGLQYVNPSIDLDNHKGDPDAHKAIFDGLDAKYAPLVHEHVHPSHNDLNGLDGGDAVGGYYGHVTELQESAINTAYEHSQTTGNPHGTDFSELENKPTTLAGYGITDATVKRSVTVSTNAGWYRLGYVDLLAGAYSRVFGNISYAGRGNSGYMGFSVTRAAATQTLEVSQLHTISCGVAPSVQWGILGDGTTIRLSFYTFFAPNHDAFVLCNIGGTVPLTNAYTHEYIGPTKPANTELVNCLDRVTLTDEPAQDVLPSGDMTQPTAIQWLRNNVKQIFTALTNKLDRVIDAGRLLISYSGGVHVNVGSSNFYFSSTGLKGINPTVESNSNHYATTGWVRQNFTPNTIGADITTSSTITPVDGELRAVSNGSTVTVTNTPASGTISYLSTSGGCSDAFFNISITHLDGVSYTRQISSGGASYFPKVVRLIKVLSGWLIEEC